MAILMGYIEYFCLREPQNIGCNLHLLQVVKYFEDKTLPPFATAYTLSYDINAYQLELGIPIAEENSELPMLATPWESKLYFVTQLIKNLNAIVPELRNYASIWSLDYRRPICEATVLGIYSRALLNYNHLGAVTQITPGANVIFQETWRSWVGSG